MLHGMATLDHTPKRRYFDSFLNYFHRANDYFNEMEGVCYKIIVIVDLNLLQI
jgi:hypothetical protein